MTLDELNLRPGDRVRFRRTSGATWHEAKVVGVERDGSVALRDAKGAARSIAPHRLEVQVRTRRGALVWEPVLEHARRTTQLRLFRALGG
ncbi:MAG: hypothetical protein ABJD24_09915 [Acidimicrobiales bacterium]